MRRTLLVAVLLPLVAACSDTAGVDSGRVTLRMGRPGAAASLGGAGGASFDHTGTGDVLTLTGTNGTLQIQDVRLIVSKFELEQQEGSCAGSDGEDDCGEFESGPFLVDLPLSGGSVTLATDQVLAGTYTKLKFEVEDLDAEEDDDAGERQVMQNILTQLRTQYPSFPSGASMLVHGTFTPTGSATAQTFTVYFDADIEVEMALNPPASIPGTTALTVTVDPASWFRSGTQVINLAQWNGQTRGFEAEIEHGFGGVEEDD